MENTANAKYKDALFKIVFGDYPENALALYNAINGTEYSNVEDLTITTLKDALFIGVKNDVSFIFNHDMSLYEHQSTFCPNMPLRGLGYFADLYEVYLGGDDIAANRIYASTPVNIPAPKFYVFYNGRQDRPDAEDLHLSSLYGGAGDLEVTAHMINVNIGHNMDLLNSCKPLADFSEFVDRVRGNRASGMEKQDAIEYAMDSCVNDHILENILRKERARIMNSLYKGITEEEYKEVVEWDRKNAREQGLAEGLAEGRAEGLAEGRAEGLAEGRAEGLAEGRAEGLAEGQEHILQMIQYLLDNGRTEDIKRVAEDEEFRQQIFSEMKG